MFSRNWSARLKMNKMWKTKVGMIARMWVFYTSDFFDTPWDRHMVHLLDMGSYCADASQQEELLGECGVAFVTLVWIGYDRCSETMFPLQNYVARHGLQHNWVLTSLFCAPYYTHTLQDPGPNGSSDQSLRSTHHWEHIVYQHDSIDCQIDRHTAYLQVDAPLIHRVCDTQSTDSNSDHAQQQILNHTYTCLHTDRTTTISDTSHMVEQYHSLVKMFAQEL